MVRHRALVLLAVAVLLSAACSGGAGPSGPVAARRDLTTTTTTAMSAGVVPGAVEGAASTVAPRPRSRAAAPEGSVPVTAGGATSTTVGAGESVEYSCPSARTCPKFVLAEGAAGNRGWRPDPDGVARIRYWLNPDPLPGAGYTRDEVIQIFDRVTKVWEAASPGRLEFMRLGLTDATPTQNDGVTMFSVGTQVANRLDQDGFIVESDLIQSIVSSGSWAPCEQRDDSCTPADDDVFIEGLITHEVGHTVGLGDLPGDKTELTMHMGGSSSTERYLVTLGLGDVLGVRHLYPCGCPMPYIYLP